MRFATIVDGAELQVAPQLVLIEGERVLPLPHLTLRGIAAAGPDGLARVTAFAAAQPAGTYRSLGSVLLGPAVPDPGAIYTIGLNYASPGSTDERPDRPMVYGKLPTSVVGPGVTVSWDRTLTPNVDGESELGVVIGREAFGVSLAEAMDHVFGYTCVNDMGSRDPWLDGDQWLLGKSMPGFCPVGPVVVTADELPHPADLRLGASINEVAIQDGSTSQMRFGIAEIIAYLSRHVPLRPGDLIATGTPSRLADPPGPERRLEAGDAVTVWVEGIGELTTFIG